MQNFNNYFCLRIAPQNKKKMSDWCLLTILLIVVAQFMYRRTNSRDASELGHYMGCVVEEEGEESEEDDHLTHSQDYKRPQLDAVSEGRFIF